MKKVLVLDGGGIRGVFTLEILLKMEELLREHYKKQDPEKAENFVLRDHFDFFAGTSTGAIIATGLCWGMKVEQILKMYIVYGQKMFQPVPWYRPFKKFLIAKFESEPLSEMLKELFIEQDGKPALLGSEQLKKRPHETGVDKLLMVVVRNNTTGSAWPLTNNPMAKYADRNRPDCNLNIPLWKLVRASTAAPTYFPPEEVMLGDEMRTFVDGAITPYNNPALIAALTAILPGYRVNWTPGPENIRVVSLGTIQFSSEVSVKNQKMWVGYYATHIPNALLQAIAWQQDYLCRFLGDCLFGETLDSEVGDLLAQNVASAPPMGRSWFSYVRYNQTYKKDDLEKIRREHPLLEKMDAVEAIPSLQRVGREYAEKNVKLSHLI